MQVRVYGASGEQVYGEDNMVQGRTVAQTAQWQRSYCRFSSDTDRPKARAPAATTTGPDVGARARVIPQAAWGGGEGKWKDTDIRGQED